MTVKVGGFFFGVGYAGAVPDGWELIEHPDEFARWKSPDGSLFYVGFPPVMPQDEAMRMARLRRVMKERASGLCAAFESLRVAMFGIGKAWKSLGLSFREMAEKEYLKHHRRLPGSSRTSRLRKKRESKVMRWYEEWLRKGGRDD